MNSYTFYNEHGMLFDHTRIEEQEQILANKYIPANSTGVLELGARYGSVTCQISKRLTNKQNLVCVEPDSRVWNALENNIKINNAFAHIIKGFISNKSRGLTNPYNDQGGYATTSIEDPTSNIPRFTLDEIKKTTGIEKFDVIVADCEGFLETFFDENPEIVKDLRLIIFEQDYPDKCNYEKVKKLLSDNGLIEIFSTPHNGNVVWAKF